MLAALVVALAAGSAFGQTLLDKVESKLKAPAPAAAAAPAARSPAAPAAAPLPGYLGADVDDTAEPGKGVLITGVKKGAPSELGGLKAGDIIVGINAKPCRNLDDLDAVLAKSTVGTKWNVQVERSGKVETKTITLGRRSIEAKPVDAHPTNDPTKPDTDPLPPPTTFRPAPPALAPATDPLAAPPGDPAATPPTLRPAADPLTPATNPLKPATDPLAAPAGDPSLELPAPPGGDKPAADPLATPPSEPSTLEGPAAGASSKATLGIMVVPLNDETRVQYEIRSPVRQGAVIVSVKPGSPADGVGLPVGGVVVSIDGQLVKTSDDLVDAISAARPGQEVELRYYQGDRINTKSITLAPAAARGVITAPPRPGMTLRNPERSLSGKFEDMVESLGPGTRPLPTVGSSIFDPSKLNELNDNIKAMNERLDALEKRVKQLEAKAGPNP
jgi:membrane-associated protease RseP (regulator of RpoE activity)